MHQISVSKYNSDVLLTDLPALKWLTPRRCGSVPVTTCRAITVNVRAETQIISATSLYVAIDLGSNSFYMLLVREVTATLQTLARIKRKVRLLPVLTATGFPDDAMERG